jgi:hypothetical protein
VIAQRGDEHQQTAELVVRAVAGLAVEPLHDADVGPARVDQVLVGQVSQRQAGSQQRTRRHVHAHHLRRRLAPAARQAVMQPQADPRCAGHLAFKAEKGHLVVGIHAAQPGVELEAVDRHRLLQHEDVFGPEVAMPVDEMPDARTRRSERVCRTGAACCVLSTIGRAEDSGRLWPALSDRKTPSDGRAMLRCLRRRLERRTAPEDTMHTPPPADTDSRHTLELQCSAAERQAAAALMELSARMFVRPALHDGLRGSPLFQRWQACREQAHRLRQRLDGPCAA